MAYSQYPSNWQAPALPSCGPTFVIPLERAAYLLRKVDAPEYKNRWIDNAVNAEWLDRQYDDCQAIREELKLAALQTHCTDEIKVSKQGYGLIKTLSQKLADRINPQDDRPFRQKIKEFLQQENKWVLLQEKQHDQQLTDYWYEQEQKFASNETNRQCTEDILPVLQPAYRFAEDLLHGNQFNSGWTKGRTQIKQADPIDLISQATDDLQDYIKVLSADPSACPDERILAQEALRFLQYYASPLLNEQEPEDDPDLMNEARLFTSEYKYWIGPEGTRGGLLQQFRNAQSVNQSNNQ